MKIILGVHLVCIFLLLSCQSSSNTHPTALDNDVIPPELNQLNTLIEQNPQEGDLWFQRGSIYYEMAKYTESIGDLEKAVTLDSLDLEAWHLLADAYLDNLQSREGLETMERTSTRFPKSIPTLLKLSEFQLILKRYPEAISTLNRLQILDPQNADALFMRGMIVKESGDTTSAIKYFQAATKENPRLIDAWINLGQLQEALGDPDALRYFDAGLTVSPGHELLLHAKSQYLARNDRSEEAKIVYRQMMEHNPYAGTPYYELGLLYLDQDSLDLAATHFDLSIKIDPMVARAYFYRGLTKELMGKIFEARHDYEQTLQLNPQDHDAQEALERVIQDGQ